MLRSTRFPQLHRLQQAMDEWLISEAAEGHLDNLPPEEVEIKDAVLDVLIHAERVQSVAPLIYLASPYADPNPSVRLMRFERVCNVAAKLLQAGLFVHTPIAHRHSITIAGQLPTEYSYWEQYDERMLMACDQVYVLMLPGWDHSEGMHTQKKKKKNAEKQRGSLSFFLWWG